MVAKVAAKPRSSSGIVDWHAFPWIKPIASDSSKTSCRRLPALEKELAFAFSCCALIALNHLSSRIFSTLSPAASRPVVVVAFLIFFFNDVGGTNPAAPPSDACSSWHFVHDSTDCVRNSCQKADNSACLKRFRISFSHAPSVVQKIYNTTDCPFFEAGG